MIDCLKALLPFPRIEVNLFTSWYVALILRFVSWFKNYPHWLESISRKSEYEGNLTSLGERHAEDQ